MNVEQAISLLVEHRNGYSCYTADAVAEAKQTLHKTGWKFRWVEDDIGYWFLECRESEQ